MTKWGSLALSVSLKRWGIPHFGAISTLQFRKIRATYFLGMGMRKRQLLCTSCYYLKSFEIVAWSAEWLSVLIPLPRKWVMPGVMAHRVLLTLFTLIFTVRQFKLISLCDKNTLFKVKIHCFIVLYWQDKAVWYLIKYVGFFAYFYLSTSFTQK